MTYKEIKQAISENERLYNNEIISIEEYSEKQWELIKKLDKHIYKLQNIHLDFFKHIRDWFKKNKIRQTD